MMRTRAVDPLRRLAGARVQPKALTAVTSMAAIKAAAVSATDGISDGGAGRYQRLVRHRSTAAAAAGATSMHPPRRVCTNGLTGMSTSVRGWGALPSSGQQGQFHSCTSCRVPSIESGGMQDTPCWKGTPQGVVGRRAMSTTKDGSPQAGAETANGITFETGKIALLADGFVVARQGGTVVMVSAVSDRKEMDESGFLPLSVDYREKAHALGKIPRTPNRREGRETDEEVLVARAVDRVLRPLFPPGYCFDTQVVATVQALEAGGDPVVVAINAASAALCVSNIPWDGPAGCVRIGRVDGKLVVNPPPESFSPTGFKDGGGLDLLYAANEYRALMIEMGGGPVRESVMDKALKLAHEHVQPLIEAQRALQRSSGKEKVLPRADANPSEEMLEEAMRVGLPGAETLFAPPPESDGSDSRAPSKADRGRAEGKVLESVRSALASSFPDAPPAARVAAAEAVLKRAMRAAIVEEGRRPDGRGVTDLRQLTGEADLLPTVHGSGLFTRGQTQTLATVTLGPALEATPQSWVLSGSASCASASRGCCARRGVGWQDPTASQPHASGHGARTQEAEPPNAQLSCNHATPSADKYRTLKHSPKVLHLPVEGVAFLGKPQEAPDTLDARLYLHYEFPPYCVNETGRVGMVNRRMVGHGNLAERAVLSVMPETEDFPYTTRVSAEVTMSNGSSSMATACATSLALMDAGVPVSAPVGGISVGLMTTDAPADGEDIGPHSILMDIQGTEDHYGDMDFKVAGTSGGITAIQLDVKLRGGVPLAVLSDALHLAKQGRTQVLGAMRRAINAPNATLKDRAPRCEIVRYEADRKKDLVGFQGQTLKGIEETFDVALDLSTEGRAVVFADNAENVAGAVKLVRELVHEIEEGDVFKGTVTAVHEYGCLVELLRNQQGLLHVSNITDKLPAPPARDIVKVGDTMDVRVVEVDRLRGLIKLASESHPSSSPTKSKKRVTDAPASDAEGQEMQQASQ